MLAVAGSILVAGVQLATTDISHLANLPLGISLALVAWIGPWITLPLALVSLAVPLVLGAGTQTFVAHVTSVMITVAQLVLSWEGYHRVAKGARRLNDPRSAT